MIWACFRGVGGGSIQVVFGQDGERGRGWKVGKGGVWPWTSFQRVPTCVIRADLYYRQEAQARLRVEHVFDDLNRLIGERERNLIFDHEIGYICSVEQGEDRGITSILLSSSMVLK